MPLCLPPWSGMAHAFWLHISVKIFIYFFPGKISMISHLLLFYFLNDRQQSKPKSHFTCINTQWIIYKSQLFCIIYAKSVTRGIHKALRMVNPERYGRLGDDWKVTVEKTRFWYVYLFLFCLFVCFLFFSSLHHCLCLDTWHFTPTKLTESVTDITIGQMLNNFTTLWLNVFVQSCWYI